jgi:hypothetical protein
MVVSTVLGEPRSRVSQPGRTRPSKPETVPLSVASEVGLPVADRQCHGQWQNLLPLELW